MTKVYTIESAIAEFTRETVTTWINQRVANNAYRSDYNKTRNEAVKIVKRDPKYREMLAAARKRSA